MENQITQDEIQRLQRIVERETNRVLAEYWIEDTAKNICSFPDEVKVTQDSNDTHVAYKLIVATKDYGHVVGKQGNNARAMRKILHTMGKTHNDVYHLDITPPSPPTFLEAQAKAASVIHALNTAEDAPLPTQTIPA